MLYDTDHRVAFARAESQLALQLNHLPLSSTRTVAAATQVSSKSVNAFLQKSCLHFTDRHVTINPLLFIVACTKSALFAVNNKVVIAGWVILPSKYTKYVVFGQALLVPVWRTYSAP